LTYWSAGHLPLFIVRGDAKEAELLFARGNVLGLGTDLQLESVETTFDPRRDRLVLASDGIVTGRLSQGRRQLPTLLESVRKDGTQALEAWPSDDDKTLVVVEPRPDVLRLVA
jgi:serine phosphatase RsbU (regulator of sigma subunit)